MKILIVEDESRMGTFVQKALAEQCYTPRLVATAALATTALSEEPFDAIVLDLGLPDGDGLDLLREWRKSGYNEPVLILSARDAVEDRIQGLNLGADDYLSKPFSIDELIARIRSLLRRQASVKATVLSHRGIKVDLLSRVVTRDDSTISLTTREFALLELFLLNPQRVLTRTAIAEKVWHASYDLETNLIDVYIRRLRKKLEHPGEPQLIRTVRGSGYLLV